MQTLRLLFALVWVLPLGAWAQSVRVDVFAGDDGEEDGLQRIPHGLSSVPRALLIWNGIVPIPDRRTGGALSYSFCDGPSSCAGMAGDRVDIWGTQSLTAVSRRVSHLDAVHVIDGGRASLEDWDETHFTLRWERAPDAGLIHFLAIGGEETQARVVRWNLPSTQPTGRVVVEDVGFSPDLLLSLFSVHSFSNVPLRQNGMSLKLSAATRGGEGGWATGTATAIGDSGVMRWLVRDRIITGGSYGIPPMYEGRLETMTEDGFVVDFPVSSGQRGLVITLALSGVQARLGGLDGPDSEGAHVQSVTGIGFTPQALLLRSVQAPSSRRFLPDNSWSMGLADRERSASSSFREFPDFASAGGLGTLHEGLYDGADGGITRLASMDPDGFTLQWEDHPGVPVDLAWLALAVDGPAPKLAFSRQPLNAAPGETLEPVEVRVTSADGAPVNGVVVRLELLEGDPALLEGALESLTVDGVARFADLRVLGPAASLRLRASVTSADWVDGGAHIASATFDVGPASYEVGCGCSASSPGASAAFGGLLLLGWASLRRARVRSSSHR